MSAKFYFRFFQHVNKCRLENWYIFYSDRRFDLEYYNFFLLYNRLKSKLFESRKNNKF